MLPGDVLLEAFGCEVAPEFIAAWVDAARLGGQKPCWINLEYLSAELVERCHGLPSPVMAGPGRGLTKHSTLASPQPRAACCGNPSCGARRPL